MIAIIDYGAGNTYNVAKAFQYLGVQTVLTADAQTILASEAVVLPGVGAFRPAMEQLEKRNLINVIKQVAANKTPLLGICLGMQLLFDSSTEYGLHAGLDLIPGKVIEFSKDMNLSIPQVGWNKNKLLQDKSVFADVAEQYTYFVHSYYAKCDAKYIVSVVDYGVSVPAIVQNDNVYGMQFHPEKSAQVGLNLLKDFIEEVVAK